MDKMPAHPKLRQTIDHCRDRKIDRAVFVVPFSVTREDILLLRELPCCQSVILRNPDPGFSVAVSSRWLGRFDSDGTSWRMPQSKAGQFIFIGPSAMLTPTMIRQMLSVRAFSVICLHPTKNFVRVPLFKFRLWHWGEEQVAKLTNSVGDVGVQRLVRLVTKVPLARTVWRRFFLRDFVDQGGAPHHDHPERSFDDLPESFFGDLITAVSLEPLRKPPLGVRPKVILVNAGLAAGGAERQIVNTLLGLRERTNFDVELLVEYMHKVAGLDFYLPQVEAADLPVDTVDTSPEFCVSALSGLGPSVVALLQLLPHHFADEILGMVGVFKGRSPAVVHAWQDSTSIKAGIAALIAGVPRVVLGSRNVPPTNFAYYQPYMEPAYQALAASDRVVLLNNSEAGAAAYTRWLGLPPERFTVVRNGVDLRDLQRVEDSTIREYRRSLGIPPDAVVVGSIFRFWAEKRPMLWLEAIARVAERFPDAHFLIVGEGPMRREMEQFVTDRGLVGRVHLPGARPEVATPLSAMNVFLLTSEFEGTPNVVLEAQWLGLPVVATDAGGTSESFAGGVTGLLATVPRAEEIAPLVVEFLADGDKLASCRVAGPRFVAGKFGVDRMIAETCRFYGLASGYEI